MTNSRNTKQKQLLEEELQKFDTIFTAEELLAKAHNVDNKIGIATIYRFLKDKASKDELHGYYCDRKQAYSTKDNSHCHFTCSQCGKTSHFKIKKLDFIKKNINGKVCHFQIDVHGICKECSKI